ncbi:MAG: hypothetical protein Kow0077_17500 [Anaerolineae bacterium]
MVMLAMFSLGITQGPQPIQSQQQSSACPQLVQAALDNIDTVCTNLEDNEACYGHILVDATPYEHVTAFQFENEGDVEDLTKLQAIRLSPMDSAGGLWGVAVMKLRAYMQYANPESVTFLLFGDVNLEDRANANAATIDITALNYSNVRLAPSAQAGVIGVLNPGQVTQANGRLEDNSWLRVVLPDTGRVGWTFAPNLTSEEDYDTLPVIDPTAPFYGPMQAFYLRSGVRDAECAESPESGMLIQTPEGVAEVTLLVNEVNIAMRATAYVQADPGNEMTLNILEGSGWVEAGGQRQPLIAGTRVRIPISEDLAASGPPSPPEPYELAMLDALPLDALDRVVEPAAPLLPEQITTAVQQIVNPTDTTNGGSTGASNGSTSDGGTSSDDEKKGWSAGPGQGGTPPGQGGTPPGQNK